MKIIICGAGQVGKGIATQLVNEHNDITVIDQQPELVAELQDMLEVKGIVGFASHPSTLEAAGARDADMVIAVTFSDEVNMVACQVAHSLFKVPINIARIRHQNYLLPEWRELYQHDTLPIDVIISPEIEVARTVNDRLHVPGAVDMIPFGDGRIKVIALRCTRMCPMANMPLHKISAQLSKLNVAPLGIFREEEFLIIDDNEYLYNNDEIYFVCDTRDVKRLMALFGYEEKEARRIIIVGGGNIGLFLATMLETQYHDMMIKIIEVNKERAEFIADKLSHTTVINGSALDQNILEEANISTAETIIAVSNDDKVNILCSLLAKRSGCQRAITLVNNNIAYGPLVASLGVDVTVSPRETTVSSILRHTRRGKIRSVHSICDGTAEIIEVEAIEASSVTGKALRDLEMPEDVKIGALLRNEKVIIPSGDTVIVSGDRIIIISLTAMAKKVENMFSMKYEYF